MDNLGLAFELLGVGMITVFVILFLVVIIGNLIIRFVNEYLPGEVSGGMVPVKGPATGPDPKKVAAIASAVSILTRGKGRITKIEKR
ncbi:MAG: OadG family protein [Prolixibacteraceae bacterium]